MNEAMFLTGQNVHKSRIPSIPGCPQYPEISLSGKQYHGPHRPHTRHPLDLESTFAKGTT
jgi:hypothetical protein